jgi:hypothetical protein
MRNILLSASKRQQHKTVPCFVLAVMVRSKIEMASLCSSISARQDRSTRTTESRNCETKNPSTGGGGAGVRESPSRTSGEKIIESFLTGDFERKMSSPSTRSRRGAEPSNRCCGYLAYNFGADQEDNLSSRESRAALFWLFFKAATS